MRLNKCFYIVQDSITTKFIEMKQLQLHGIRLNNCFMSASITATKLCDVFTFFYHSFSKFPPLAECSPENGVHVSCL